LEESVDLLRRLWLSGKPWGSTTYCCSPILKLPSCEIIKKARIICRCFVSNDLAETLNLYLRIHSQNCGFRFVLILQTWPHTSLDQRKQQNPARIDKKRYYLYRSETHYEVFWFCCIITDNNHTRTHTHTHTYIYIYY